MRLSIGRRNLGCTAQLFSMMTQESGKDDSLDGMTDGQDEPGLDGSANIQPRDDSGRIVYSGLSILDGEYVLLAMRKSVEAPNTAAGSQAIPQKQTSYAERRQVDMKFVLALVFGMPMLLRSTLFMLSAS